jgi:hypothetical protein
MRRSKRERRLARRKREESNGLVASTKHKFRSRYEALVAGNMEKRGIRYQYESRKCKYVVTRNYTPDFELGKDLFIETKGRFTSADRTKLLRVRDQNPDIEIRLLFMRDNRLSKSSLTTYTQWATANGFVSAVGKEVPEEWITKYMKK